MRNPLKVLHLLWDGDLGGVQRYLLKVVASSAWEHVEHGVCFFRSPGAVLNGTDLFDWHTSLNLKQGWDLPAARKLEQLIAPFNADVIHCHCDTPAFSLQIHKFEKYRLIYTEHGDTLNRAQRNWFTRPMWKYSGKYWDCILENSHFMKTYFDKLFPHLQEKTRVVMNPLIEFPSMRQTVDWNGPKQLGVFCRHAPEKGLDLLFEATVKIKDQLPGMKIHLYGDGPLRQELEELSRSMGLGEIVIFHGYVDNPIECMSHLHCLVVPSRLEAFALASLEAQAVGVPVICFDNTGVAEVIKSGETGEAVAWCDTDALAASLLGVLTNPEKAKKWGQAAHERATSCFSLDTHVEMLMQVYRGTGD
ncbi:glycosyltransferase family 4 protein [Pontiellaceae bacterium B12227]|nr:glycosyltransferase family 4 protein [Pontiellaceae bacterium B12227]